MKPRQSKPTNTPHHTIPREHDRGTQRRAFTCCCPLSPSGRNRHPSDSLHNVLPIRYDSVLGHVCRRCNEGSASQALCADGVETAGATGMAAKDDKTCNESSKGDTRRRTPPQIIGNEQQSSAQPSPVHKKRRTPSLSTDYVEPSSSLHAPVFPWTTMTTSQYQFVDLEEILLSLSVGRYSTQHDLGTNDEGSVDTVDSLVLARRRLR